MPKTVTANEAKNRLGALMSYVSQEDDEVIVERHGRPTAAIVSMATLEDARKYREQQWRKEALEELRQVQERVAARNQDVTDEESIEFAIQFSRKLIDNMAERGEITFERDLR